MPEPSQGRGTSPVPSADLAAYDALPATLRAALVASPWPIPAVLMERAYLRGGTRAALHRLRDQERVHAHYHERVMAEACER